MRSHPGSRTLELSDRDSLRLLALLEPPRGREAACCREMAAEAQVSVSFSRGEPVSKSHNVFDCGETALKEFLQRYARKTREIGGANTFLAISQRRRRTILGYYSLSPASVAYARTPKIVRRGLARYEVPAFRLARLAVDLKVQGQGLGGQLWLAAGK